MGCGTGAISLHAVKKFKKVYSVDVSNAMITMAKKQVPEKDTSKIEFHNGGFLSYSHKGTPVDIIFTKAALHHLPDFWKQVALINMNKMLKNGGVFYIFDIIFGFPPSEYKKRIDTWISNFVKHAGPDFQSEVETHIRDEYSTFRWIIDGMIERAGFKIVKCQSNDGIVTEYYCEKIRDV
jgi:ubiquinone/menaquinone biosynthesis C-methylase UbiE